MNRATLLRFADRTAVVLAIVGLLLGIYVAILHLTTDPLADARAYYDAGARLNAGQPLYVALENSEVPGAYFYPPLLAIVFRPLALLPYEAAALIWGAVVVAATLLTFRIIGIRRPVLIVAGWLALPILWTVTIGQAQAVITLLLTLGAPWAVALAANIKLFPALVAVYWVGRREWRRLGIFAAWMAGLLAFQFILEPTATVDYVHFLTSQPVGDVNNLSPYAISPVDLGGDGRRDRPRRAAPGADPLGLGGRGRPVRLRGTAPAELPALDAPGGIRRSRRGPNVSGDQRPTASPGRTRLTSRLPGMSPAESLTIVLPAYNEAERIGPALDELFGYLLRRGEHAREGAPGSSELPAIVDVLVVDDGSTDGTAALVAARPEAAEGVAEAGAHLRVMTVPHGGKGAAVRAGMLAAPSDLVIFADADMATPPDQLPLLVAALADHDVALGSRIQPDGSDMRASQPVYRRMLGKVFHVLASIWVVGPVKDTQCGFKGFTPGGGAGPLLAPAGHEHRLRRRAHLPRPATRRPDRDRPGPLGGPPRVSHARAARARAAGRVGPVPDPAPASASASGRGGAVTTSSRLRPVALVDRGHPGLRTGRPGLGDPQRQEPRL